MEGPDKSKQLSGYITIPGFANDSSTHYFYWFFESRNKPETAPFILWLTGGPGCSSILALFIENGPYKVTANMSLEMNPYSWNEVANILWLDQPVGTGFSYSDNPGKDVAWNEDEIAEDLYQFLQGFFGKNPKYNKKVFIFGESYAGHYVPAISKRIVLGNARVQPGDVKIDLQGAAIGNGLTDPYIQYGAHADYLSWVGLIDPISRDLYNTYGVKECQSLLGGENWLVAMIECNLAMGALLKDAEFQNDRSINVYNVWETCDVPPFCYNFTLETKFLGLPQVKKALGANPKIEWLDCNMGVTGILLEDWMQNNDGDVAIVLETGVRVMIYAGTDDFICNAIGNERWVEALEWPGKNAFNAAPFVEWRSHNGDLAGQSKSSKGLSYVQVYHAGHFAPMDQPVNTLEMVQSFLSNTPIGAN